MNYLEITTFSRDSVSNRLNFDQRRKLENRRGFEKGMASIDEFYNYQTKIIFQ